MDFSNVGMKLTNQFVKPVENFAICYLASKYIFNNTGKIKVPFLKDQDVHLGLGIFAGVSSAGAELAHNWILPEIVQGNQWQSSASMVLTPSLVGLGVFALAGYSDGYKVHNALNARNLVLLGAGSEIASTYLNDNFVQPWLNPVSY